MTATPIIDLHAHWLPPGFVDLLKAREQPPRIVDTDAGIALDAGGSAPIGRAMPLSAQWYELDARIRLLDESGIAHQLIAWPTTLGVDVALGPEQTLPLWTAYNDELAALVATHPDRFSGVAVLSTSDVEWSARELRRAHEQLGLVGAVLPVGSVVSLETARHFAPVFEVAQEFGSLIYLHTGLANAAAPGQPPAVPHDDTAMVRWIVDASAHFTQAFATLAYTDFLDEYPAVDILVAMLGGTGLAALVAEQVAISGSLFGEYDADERLARIYFDTGATGRGSEAIALAVNVFGARQVVFGTDLGPFPAATETITNVAAARIDDDARELIYSGNARRLLGRRAPNLSSATTTTDSTEA